MHESDELKRALKNGLGKHLHDAEIVRYHDNTLREEALRRRIELHLALCQACSRRLDAADLIHPTQEELMDYHEGIVRNARTHARVKAHLRERNCPLCGGWLDALRQAQEEAVRGQQVPPVAHESAPRFLHALQDEKESQGTLALLAPLPSAPRQLIVRREELRTLGVQPYVHIAVRKGRSGSSVRLTLEPLERHPPTKRGTVEVRLIRPASKAAITVKLGSHDTGEFVYSAGRFVRDYRDGEERQWDAEVSVRPGALWKQQQRELAEWRLAASEGHAAPTEARPPEQLALIPMGTFEVAGTSYEALTDFTGEVFLTPPPESGKTRLVLDTASYPLERVEGDEELCRVRDLGRGRLGLFFARRRRAKDQPHIGFA